MLRRRTTDLRVSPSPLSPRWCRARPPRRLIRLKQCLCVIRTSFELLVIKTKENWIFRRYEYEEYMKIRFVNQTRSGASLFAKLMNSYYTLQNNTLAASVCTQPRVVPAQQWVIIPPQYTFLLISGQRALCILISTNSSFPRRATERTVGFSGMSATRNLVFTSNKLHFYYASILTQHSKLP